MTDEHLSLLMLVHFEQKRACILLMCAFFQKGDLTFMICYKKTETRAVKVFYFQNK